ncbi:hypothetical protein DID88_003864 [Monilinia fructigena]|uniref:Uncharacterized protein n=1 Tax=Monilinia fructigena TaxID=38457 RepID=A0A395IUB8_9HELO|nr:hypothetical protein DID88_003864 [Monilinia fructigena]
MSSPRVSAIEQNHIKDGSTDSSFSNSHGKLRFRHGSSARYDSDFKGQVWVKTSGKICSEFVDEFPELDEIYTAVPKRENTTIIDSTIRRSRTPQSVDSTYLVESATTSCTKSSKGSFSKHQAKSPVKRRRADDESSFSSSKHPHVKSYPRRPAKVSGDLTESSILGEVVPLPPVGWNLSIFYPQELNIQTGAIDELLPVRNTGSLPFEIFFRRTGLLGIICKAPLRLEQYRKNGVVEYNGKQLPNLHMETVVEYHSKCIEHLVSASDIEALCDENLLVASIILRFYEEVDAPLSGGDWETAQRGTQVFITAQASGGLDSSLRRAAFRVAYRQEVHMAFVRQRPFHMPLQCHEYRSSNLPMIPHGLIEPSFIVQMLLEYCYGHGSKTNSDYDMLVQYHEGWESLRPQSFDALYERAASSNASQALPEIWYLSDYHVTAHQHMGISQILLTTYNPRVPRLGPGLRTASQRIETQVNTMVKRLCGVAISNHRSPPAMNIACMAISMCGEQLKGTEEQESILEVLKYTEKQHAWPTKHIQDRLIEAWRCNRKENNESWAGGHRR